ncbi:response regulator [bacterium]|nr:response regulator [bacterium]
MAKGPARRKIRVAVVDDDEDVCLLIKDMLDGAQDFSCAGSFSSAAQALADLPRMHPDLVLMDICMPDVDGIECTKHLKQMLPRLKIIMVTGCGDAASIENARRCGADSYLIKPVAPDQYLAALKFAVVRRGSRPRNRESGHSTRPTDLHGHRSGLTPRENELMKCFARGLLYKEAADKLGISHAVVHKLQHKIFAKLHVGNKTEAISKWRGLKRKSSGLATVQAAEP